jgi:hypothetical protein
VLILGFQFNVTTALQQSWTPDQDYNLVGVLRCNNAATTVVSTDPSITDSSTVISTITTTTLLRDVIYGSGAGNILYPPGVKIPIQKDRTIYVANNVAKSLVLLYLEELSAE